MKRIERIRAASTSYDVTITSDGFEGLAAVMEPWVGRQTALITDENVGRLYGASVMETLAAAGVPAVCITVPAGEATKSFGQLQDLMAAIVDARVNRDGVVVALGGGVVGDLAALAASLLRRGVDCVQIATSLIAQVDSAVGGKTAINIPQGKNLVGTFHQPAAVFCPTRCLFTLPPAERRSGMAEVVKYAMLHGEELLSEIEGGIDAIEGDDAEFLVTLVSRCVRIKGDIVERDVQESGERRWLNFGHTVGHAVESTAGYGVIRHGEAVAVGMVAACLLSAHRGLLPASTVERLRTILQRLGLPVVAPPLPRDEVVDALLQDKKTLSDGTRWVFLGGVGKPEVHKVNSTRIPEMVDFLAAEGVLEWETP